MEGLSLCNFFLLNRGTEMSLPTGRHRSVGKLHIYIQELPKQRHPESKADNIYEHHGVSSSFKLSPIKWLLYNIFFGNNFKLNRKGSSAEESFFFFLNHLQGRASMEMPSPPLSGSDTHARHPSFSYPSHHDLALTFHHKPLLVWFSSSLHAVKYPINA